VRKVIHLIPYDGIGGVEIAAKSMLRVIAEDLDFQVETIFPPVAASNQWVMLKPFWFLRIVLSLMRRKPDVLIVSLWRAYAVGVLLKILRPRLRLVLFLHFPKDVHGLDRFFSRLAAHLSCNIWADSNETLARRLPNLYSYKYKVISFVTSRIAELSVKPVRPVFIFWGRIHAQKGLQRALQIFAGVHSQIPQARFYLIGPDRGELENLRKLAGTLELKDALHFLAPMNFVEIQQRAAEASFYLQTSELEGMAMSVVEAMQLGLVPVVTPVGEIAHYAEHNKNAIVVQNDLETVANLLALLNDNLRYQKMRRKALATWSNQPLYKDSVINACRDVLEMDKVIKAT